MKIIEIIALDNGAHNNQEIMGVDPSTFPIPEGWAVIRDGVDTPNFPFGDFQTEKVNDVVYMKDNSWAPGEIPEPEPEPEPTPEVDPVMQVYNELDAAYQEGVNGAYDE